MIKEENIILSGKTLLISGGTFGHVYPAIVLSEKYNCDLFLHTNSEKFFKEVTNKFSFFTFEKKMNPVQFIKILNIFYKKIKDYDQIIIFGGYTVFPSILISLLFLLSKKKFYFHEQNSVIGLVNKIAYWFRFIPLLSFKNTTGISSSKYFKKAIIFGYPIQQPIDNIENKTELKIKSQTQDVLILPGSGGSDFFDKNVAPVIAKMFKSNSWKIYFVARNPELVKKILPKNAVVSNFFFNIDEIIKNSEIIIGRSGAGIISKIFLYEKKAILIPLSDSAHNHQLINAQNSKLSFLEECNISKLPPLITKILNKKLHLIIKNTNLLLKVC